MLCVRFTWQTCVRVVWHSVKKSLLQLHKKREQGLVSFVMYFIYLRHYVGCIQVVDFNIPSYKLQYNTALSVCRHAKTSDNLAICRQSRPLTTFYGPSSINLVQINSTSYIFPLRRKKSPRIKAETILMNYRIYWRQWWNIMSTTIYKTYNFISF